MEIEQKDTQPVGEFIASVDSNEAGKLFYSWAGIDTLIIKHTETYPAFAGQGVGLALVSAVVDFARKKNVKVMPVCKFAKAQFRKHADWADVLY